MTKSILAVNAGSSSVKVTFYTLDRPPKMIANAQVSGLTAPPQTLKYSQGSKQHKEQLKESLSTPPDAFKYLLKRLFEDPQLSEVTSIEDLAYICHRIVHGGDYTGPVEINEETLGHLKDLEDLAPLYVAAHSYLSVSGMRVEHGMLMMRTGITSPRWKSSARADRKSPTSKASLTSIPRSTTPCRSM